MLKKRIFKKSRNFIILLLFILLLSAIGISFCIGRLNVPLSEVLKIFLSRFIPIEGTWTANMEAAVLNIRLPRILLACLVGSSLAAAGACYQGIFHNPMASPDILGASNGAAFGAALAILLGLGSQLLTASAFLFSLISIFAVYLIAKISPGQRTVNLILAGIMIGSVFSAGVSYVKLVADPTDQLPAITYWLMGSLSGNSLNDVLFTFIPIVLGTIPLILLRWRINLLTLSDDEAKTMGISTDKLRLIVIVCATLITAASVSVSGMIGWVGLVVPHLARKLIGNDYRYLLPASMLLGALFLLIVDNVSRNLLPTEIPIGILTAFIGAPFFLYLLLRRKYS